MGSYNSGDHIAVDHTHTDTTTCNTEGPQQKYRLGTVSNCPVEKECKHKNNIVTSFERVHIQQDKRDAILNCS